MRFLIKIPIPKATENPLVANPKFNDLLRALYVELRAEANYSVTQDQRRVDYILVDVEPGEMAAVARPIYQLVRAKVEFMPETTPAKRYGHVNR